MIIDIKDLLTGRVNSLDISQTISFELDSFQQKCIKRLEDINVDVHAYKDDLGNIYFDIEIEGNMILTCVRTCKEVSYPFSTKYSTDIEQIYEDLGKINEKIQNTLDIQDSLWQNIVVEVPLRIVSEDAKEENIYGDGWKLITDPTQDKQLDPRLEKLKELL